MTPYAIGSDWRLYAGECSQVMRDCIEDESIDLVVTSPPYDPVYMVDGRLVTDHANGQRDYNGYTWDFVDVATQLWRVTKPGAVLVWVVGDKTIDGSETGTPERQKLFFMDLGFRCHDTMIYQKLANIPTQDRYYDTFEFVYVFSKGKPKTMNFICDRKNAYAGSKKKRQSKIGGENKSDSDGYFIYADYSRRSNIWRYATGKGHSDDISFEHPATFPEALARDHIISWSNPGDTVLDCFVGSGTTGKMSAMLGRPFIGIDISGEYLEIAKRRIDLVRLPLFEQPEVEVTAEQLGLNIS